MAFRPAEGRSWSSLVAQGCTSERPLTVSGLGLVSWKFPQGSDKATPLPGPKLRHPAAEHCRCRSRTVGTNSVLSSKASSVSPAIQPPSWNLDLFSGCWGGVGGKHNGKHKEKHKEKHKGEHKAFPSSRCSHRSPRGGASGRSATPPSGHRPASLARSGAQCARGGGAAGRGGAILLLCEAAGPGRARAEGAPGAVPAATAGRGMDTHYYGGEQSDDGGATPVQDERDSGSDVEDEGNEQHSGSENESVGHHSENEHSDGEDDGQVGEPHMTDSENEDIPRQKESDSDNEEPPNHNVSDSENEATHGGKDSDSDTEDRPNRHISDSENEDSLNHRASDSDNGEPPRDHSSDFENEESHKQAASDSESEELQKQAASDSESEELQKQPVSDSESEELQKQPASDSESEDVSRHKQIESEDSDGEDRKEKVQNDSHHSDNEHVRKEFQGSDSEDEAPKRRKISDSDEDEKEEEKTVKRKTAILSDSEDDNEKTPAKKVRILSDAEESDSDAASEKSDKRKKNAVSDSEEEEEEEGKENAEKKKGKDLFGSDSESGNEQENLIADIFGESGDEEEEEFTGFNQEDLEEEKGDGDMKETADESDSDDNIKRGKHMDFMSDFDMMLQRKKSMSGKRRRNRDGGTFISDADDVVSAMIVKMNEAAEEDRQLNTQKKPALKKLTLLPTVVMHLKKQDLKETFIDSGVMSAIKEWLSPLPDRSLPALKIREELLKILQELPSVSQETLKHSGIGRAVMYLYKHPKESRPNKDMAGKLINEWSRPIFGLTSNYKGMTREEREQRDLEQMPHRRKMSSSGGQTPRRDLEKVLTGEEKALRPGDPGFCARARVPMPSNKDYVVRPKWNVEMESSRPGTIKRGISRLEKHKRRFAEQKRLSKVHRAIKFSIEGNRMPL